MDKKEIFVGGWYKDNDDIVRVTMLTNDIETNDFHVLIVPYVNGTPGKLRTANSDKLQPLKIEPVYLLQNGWDEIDEDPDDGSKCYGIDVSDKFSLDWWTPSEKVNYGLLALHWAEENMPIEMRADYVHELQLLLMYWKLDPFKVSAPGKPKTDNKKPKKKHKKH